MSTCFRIIGNLKFHYKYITWIERVFWLVLTVPKHVCQSLICEILYEFTNTKKLRLVLIFHPPYLRHTTVVTSYNWQHLAICSSGSLEYLMDHWPAYSNFSKMQIKFGSFQPFHLAIRIEPSYCSMLHLQMMFTYDRWQPPPFLQSWTQLNFTVSWRSMPGTDWFNQQ